MRRTVQVRVGLIVVLAATLLVGRESVSWASVSRASDSGARNHGGIVNVFDQGIDAPDGIAAGPDGALWFTNIYNGSIGRITTSGVVSNFTSPGIDVPIKITAGPDGALWFTNS